MIMRKSVIMTVMIGTLMVVSCSEDRIVGIQQESAIEFRTLMDRQTKAVAYTAGNLTSFNVTAKLSDSYYMSEVDYLQGEGGIYSSVNKYFWPASGTLDFYAYAPKQSATNGVERIDEHTYKVTPLTDTGSQIDFLFAKNSGSKASNSSSGVTLNFRHVMSQIRVSVKNTEQTLRFVVTGWKVASVKGQATFSFDNSLNTNGENLATLNRNLWGEYGSGVTSYTTQHDEKTVTGTNTSWGELAGSSILIPQTTTGANAYDAGGTPNGSYVAVELQAFNVSNNEPVFTKQWCCWPVSFDWQPGYRYTYNIDLAQCGYKENGTGQLDPVLENVEVKFIDVTVDAWQPDGGSNIDVTTDNSSSGNTNPTNRYDGPCLRFHTENGSQTLYMTKTAGTATVTNLEYSVDEGETWNELLLQSGDNNGVTFGVTGTKNRDVLVRGNQGFSNNMAVKDQYEIRKFSFKDSNQPVECTGMIGYLTDYNNPTAALTENGQYAGLFYDCSCLTTIPSLPSTVLTKNCYRDLFHGCTGITQAPVLPAETLQDYCYASMFSGCSNLASAPALPSAVMARHCYDSMFSGCKSITDAPALPALELADSCYKSMFMDCSKLSSAPALPATSMAIGCYILMLSNCESLTVPPVLASTQLADYCYSGMFYGSGITSAPALPATALKTGCYESMFRECTSLTAGPQLPAMEMAKDCYKYMFANCDFVTSPDLPATTLAEGCYYSMYWACLKLKNVPDLPALELPTDCYSMMFSRARALVDAPAIKATTIGPQSCYMMFADCPKLVNAPALSSTELSSYCYAYMFQNDSCLVDAPSLPATNLKAGCYMGMFRGCANLVSAPELNAKQLQYKCYEEMFKGCSSLSYLKATFYEYLFSFGNPDYPRYMSGWLDGVAASGTLVKYAQEQCTNDIIGAPAGWILVDDNNN